MAEILPNGAFQNYFGFCSKCGFEIETNIQGNPINHTCKVGLKLEDVTAGEATHKLMCCHCIGRNTKYYHMDCIPVKAMKNGKVKIIVFGDRYWKNKEDIKRYRYVERNQILNCP